MGAQTLAKKCRKLFVPHVDSTHYYLLYRSMYMYYKYNKM